MSSKFGCFLVTSLFFLFAFFFVIIVINIKIIEEWFHFYNLKSKKQKIILSLSLIGYDTRKVFTNTRLYYKLIKAYKIRYMNNIGREKDSIYDTLIKHLFNFMLTKN